MCAHGYQSSYIRAPQSVSPAFDTVLYACIYNMHVYTISYIDHAISKEV